MERKKRRRTARQLTVLALAGLLVAIASFSVSRLSRAAPPPSVAISMDDTALSAGETANVTFSFSSQPFGFTNADVDLSDTHGVLSTVEADSADPSRYTAVFTPDSGVNDPTNTIIVGTQWNDSGGVSPSGPSASANFTIQTVPAGGGSCPPPTVTLTSPNGGETFVPGSGVDVYWTMNGCQATSLELLLSSDGGATYAASAVSPQPTYGYYRWTVPDQPSPSSRLEVRLLGSGGTILAADASDGTFAIQPSTPPPSPGTPTPAATSTPPTPPAPPPPPATSATTTPAAPGGTPVTPATPAPPPVKKKTAATTATPAPNPPAPIPAPVPQDAPTQTIDSPMNTADQNPAAPAAPAAVTLDGAQNAVETASEFAPSSLEMAFSFAAGALAMLSLLLGAQQVIKRRAAKTSKPCHTCHGTGREPADKKTGEKCDACDGTGQVEDENEPSVECKHCDGEGEDPCHVCKGSGKRADGGDCPACKGGGKTLTGKKDKDGEDEIADCEFCRGEGELSATIKKMIPCDKCGGTGKI